MSLKNAIALDRLLHKGKPEDFAAELGEQGSKRSNSRGNIVLWPAFPSAQMWRNMTQEQKDALEDVLISRDIDPKIYYAEMGKHFPFKQEVRGQCPTRYLTRKERACTVTGVTQ